MSNDRLTEKQVRNTLGILLLFVALNAFAGGYYGLTGAKNIPTEWLNGSPFHNYLLPSLLLFVVVGGAALIVFTRGSMARKAALFVASLFLSGLAYK